MSEEEIHAVIKCVLELYLVRYSVILVSMISEIKRSPTADKSDKTPRMDHTEFLYLYVHSYSHTRTTLMASFSYL